MQSQSEPSTFATAKRAVGAIKRFVLHPEFKLGAQEMASLSIGLAAWGLVAGVAMVKSGLAVPLCILMSLTVFAGSAQLASLPLISSGAPIWVVWATATCVNLRFLIFSAQWRPYFGGLPLKRRMLLSYFAADMNFVTFMKRFPQPQPAPEQLPYYLGGVAINWVSWQGASILGILLADQVPTHWGLGFAGVLALLALTYALLQTRRSWVAAIVASTAAVAAYALPLRLNIVVAIAAAVAIGVLMEHVKPGEPKLVGRTS